jgi:hypothetical protein
MGPHVPSAPDPFFAAVHAWHGPSHAALQHTPSTQLPLVHSGPDAQDCPLPRITVQIEPLQNDAGAQSVFAEHELEHAPDTHLKGAQGAAVDAMQVP